VCVYVGGGLPREAIRSGRVVVVVVIVLFFGPRGGGGLLVGGCWRGVWRRVMVVMVWGWAIVLSCW